jgi:hypothetical protein
MRRFNMFLTDPHDKALTKLSKERDVPIAALVREAIDLYLSKRSSHAGLPKETEERRRRRGRRDGNR